MTQSKLIAKGKKLIQQGVEENFKHCQKTLNKLVQKNAQDVASTMDNNYLTFKTSREKLIEKVFTDHLFKRNIILDFLCHAMANTAKRLDAVYLDDIDNSTFCDDLVLQEHASKIKKLLQELQKCQDLLKKINRCPKNEYFFSHYRDDQLSKATSIKTVKQFHVATSKDIQYLAHQTLQKLAQNKMKYFNY